MRIAEVFGLAALFAAVAGEICKNCSSHGPLSANLTILETPDDVFVSVGPPPPPPRRLEPATDEVWNKCREKGCLLSWAMHHDDREVGPRYDPRRNTAASPYQSHNDLRTWYWFSWIEEISNQAYFDFYRTWGVGSALVALGVSPNADTYEGGENRVLSMDHKRPKDATPVQDQRYSVGNKIYRATGASFAFSVNAKDGVIIGLNRESPKEAGKRLEPPVAPDQMPGLNQFSDVAWLEWEAIIKERNGDVKNLRYLMAALVVNRETQSVALRAANSRGTAVEDWPGHTYEAGTDEFNAVLGTPNMQGFAYMLVQHKAQLGNMYISKVQVFRCKTERRPPCIIAHVSRPEANPGKSMRRDGGHDMVRVHKVFAKL